MGAAKLLVIGRESFVGSYLKLLTTESLLVESTQYRDSSEDRFLDLADSDSISRFDFSGYTHVAICSAITNVDYCELNMAEANLVNCQNIKLLLEQLKSAKSIPIFFSSDLVYSHDLKISFEGSLLSPKTVYGKQKKEVETFIMNTFDKLLIFRCGKIISMAPHPRNMLTGLIDSLSDRNTVFCAQDQVISLVFVEDICKVVKKAILEEASGVFNLAMKLAYNRCNLVSQVCEKFNFDLSLIEQGKLEDLKLPVPRPTISRLDNKKISKALNFTFMDLGEAMQIISDSHSKINNKSEGSDV